MPEPVTDRWTWARHHLLLSNSRQAWEDRLGLLTLVLGAGGMLLFATQLELSRQFLLWLLLFVVLAVLLRHGWLRLFGPVLSFELVQVSRRNRYFLMRLLYIMGLSLLLCWFYWAFWMRIQFTDGRIALKEQAQFAEGFFYTFMWVQFLAVVVLTPAYTAGAIADEKDRKTLEFLLATDLQNREIVLGKWLARVGNLTLLVVGGIPILALNLFLGGVDPDLMVAGFVATGLTLFGLAGVSILTSVYGKRARDAIVLSYLIVAAYYALSTTLTVLAFSLPAFGNLGIELGSWSLTVLDLSHWLASGNIFIQMFHLLKSVYGGGLVSALPELLREYALFHGLLTLGTVGLAVRRLRAVAIKEQTVKALKRGSALRRRAGVGRHPPMVWKEVFADGGQRMHVAGYVVLLLLVALSFVPLILIIYWYVDDFFTGRGTFGRNWDGFSQSVNYWTAIAGMLVACLTLLGVGVRAAGSISGERDKQTFDSLLTTPLTSNEMLWGKWLGSLTGMRWGLTWVCLIWVIGALLTALHPVLLVLLLGAWVVYAGVIALIGLWFSMVSKTSLRATMWTLVTTLGCSIGHWLLWSCCLPFFMFLDRGNSVPEDLFQVIAKVQMGLSPPLVLVWMVPWRGQDFGQSASFSRPFAPEELLGYALLGLVIWALLGAGLWAALSTRFQRLTGREPRVAERRPPAPRNANAQRGPC